MSGIQRFISYIYAYNEGEKGSNVGYLKIEIRGEEGRFEIHLRDIYSAKEVCRASFFRVAECKLQTYPVEDISLYKGKSDFIFRKNIHDAAKVSCEFSEMDGMIFTDGSGGIYATRWRDGEEVQMLSDNIEEVSDKVQKNMQATSVSATPKVIPIKNQVIFPEVILSDAWKKHEDARGVFWEKDAGDFVGIRMELKDLRDFPKEYWCLGNNSFLLHGFFNYQYLLFGRKGEDEFFLGVPGIFQRQERVMAMIFGFGDFVSERESAEDEPIPEFGYWCHFFVK